MRVYRIEHKVSGMGPFCTDGIGVYYDRHNGGYAVHNDCAQWPTPNDEGLKITPELVCAAKDIEQLRHWFGMLHLPETLEECGYVVRVYDGNVVATGERQILFNKSQADVVEEHSPLILEQI